MRIKMLEIKGFKSFCNRTVLNFTNNITAIVGPNGCGKSNTVDAIRWVLGEQSAKDLRGRTMEDVIFNGTATEKPIGMAEVNLMFSNENGDAPEAYADFTEIMITRRLYRSGESEYLINRINCRRRDIIEFFMGTGIGKNSYSIIEQGKVESLINARPAERRALIEEASGISRYRSQRETALNKMETTQASLLRVSDMENELKRQINALRRQARKADQYKKIRQEIRKLELGTLVVQYKTGCREVTSLEEQLQTVREQEVSLSNTLQTEELMLEEARLKVLEGERETTSIQQQIYDLKVQVEKIDNRFGLINRRIKDLENARERQELELNQSIKRLEQEKSNAGKLRKEAAEIENRILQCRKELEEVSAQYRVHKKDMSLWVDELNQAKSELARVEANSVRLEAECGNLKRRLEEEKNHSETLVQEEIVIEQEMTEVSQNLDDVSRRIEQSLEIKKGLNEKHEKSSNRLACVLSEIEKVSNKLDSQRQELSGKLSRLQSLKELESRYEWFDGGVQEIMRRWQSDRSGNGVHALAVDIFKTDPQFEAAVEAALAQMLQSIIIKNPRESISSIEHLKANRAGRVSFIPISPRYCDNEKIFMQPNEDGIIGPLIKHVEIMETYKNLGQALLGDFLLVKDLTTAVSLWERQNPVLPMVTLDGEVLTPMGAISGGINGEQGKNILHRKREIRELSMQVDELRSFCAVTQQEMSSLGRQRSEAEKSVESLRNELQKEEIQLTTAIKDQAACEDIYRRLSQRQKSLNQQQESSNKAIESLILKLDEKSEESEVTAEKLSGLNIRVESADTLVQEHRGTVETLEDEVTRLKVDLSAMEQRSRHLNEDIIRLEENKKEGSEKVKFLENAQKNVINETSEMMETKQRLESEKVELVEQQLKIQEKLESLRAELRRDSQEQEEREVKCKQLRKELNELTTQLASKLNLEISKVQINLKHLEERAEERHAVVISKIALNYETEDIDPENVRSRLEQLRSKLDDLGEVNLLAAKELEELETRCDHLGGQRDDLIQAMKDLEKTIARIDKETRHRFMETFAQANLYFGKIFPLLFTGGKGELILTGNDDPLEAGVELVVQPPGKKLQSISLLSGGEKALSAVALIFSMFLIKPSPLCLLDEVDASMDDVNIDRFIHLIQKYRDQYQFIIVTHNKRTMAIADTLYGITMEEPGVSKLVSVSLKGRDERRLGEDLQNDGQTVFSNEQQEEFLQM